ncbi:MAG: glycosyltransferase [Chloroflexi bacterium]|nr:MAG: glycosyltransferase [Chloroflexota bacterium]
MEYGRLNNSAFKGVLLVGLDAAKPNGLSMAFRLVIHGMEERGIPFHVINTESKRASRQVGAFSLGRALQGVGELVRFITAVFNASSIYITIGLSKGSFLRDCFMIWVASLLRRRVVLHVHSGGYGLFYDEQSTWMKQLIRRTLSKAQAIIVLGELLREQFSFLTNADDLLVVVPNALPFDLLPVVDNSIRDIYDSEPVRLLYLSNLIEAKGYLDCLEACHILNQRGIPVHLSFCGEFVQHVYGSQWNSAEEAKENFFERIQAYGLEEFVDYHGVVLGDEKQKILEQSHVLILPTWYPWEGQPISIIEALAFGLPVISTCFRGIPEQIVDGYNGYLVESKQPAQIAEKVEHMWKDAEKYKQFCLNARKQFEQNFTSQIHLDRLIPIILGSE